MIKDAHERFQMNKSERFLCILVHELQIVITFDTKYYNIKKLNAH